MLEEGLLSLDNGLLALESCISAHPDSQDVIRAFTEYSRERNKWIEYVNSIHVESPN